jgi:tetratricopeptide (TPR) repeat protein
MKIIQRFGLLALLALFSVQLAGCGAAEVSSAKLYRNQRNYVKANERLEEALKKNPQDPEAWALYVTNLYDLNQYERIAEVIDTAYKYAVDYRTDIDMLRFNTWVALYNGGVGAFEQNPESPTQQQSAKGYLESARLLMPDRPETYAALGTVYEAMGDTVTAVATYKEALNQVRSSHEQGIAKGLMLRMSPESAERAMGGAPQSRKMVAVSASDSAMVFLYPGSQTYLYFERADRGARPWELTGWKFGVTEQVGVSPMRVSTDMYKTVANYYYQRGQRHIATNNINAARTEFDQALPMLFAIQRLDPSDQVAAQFIPDIYIKTNQANKAKEQYERLLSENPSKALYTSYGTFLLQTKDYEPAINAYQKALEMDPSYEAALYNIAASYKNWAAAEQAAKKKDYKQKLEKSTEYFERLVQVNPNEFTAIQNLVENYDLLGAKDKQSQILSRVEGMKSSQVAQTAEYWDLLGSLYARTKGREKEAEDALRRADTLRNK